LLAFVVGLDIALYASTELDSEEVEIIVAVLR
jgi:hypothetical protein